MPPDPFGSAVDTVTGGDAPDSDLVEGQRLTDAESGLTGFVQFSGGRAFVNFRGQGGNAGPIAVDTRQWVEPDGTTVIYSAGGQRLRETPPPEPEVIRNAELTPVTLNGEPTGLYQTSTGRTGTLEELLGTSGGGGGVTGARPPNPLAVAQSLMEQYDQLLAATGMDDARLVADFNAKVDQAEQDFNAWQSQFDITESERADRLTRETSEASRQLRIQEEAGSRGRTFAQDILPFVMPGLQNIGFAGQNFPVPQLQGPGGQSFGGPIDIFDFGQGPLSGTPIAPQSPVPFGDPFQAPDLGGLDFGDMPLPPNIQALLEQILQGFGGFASGGGQAFAPPPQAPSLQGSRNLPFISPNSTAPNVFSGPQF